MPRCWIAMGGNQGRVSETIRCALIHLDELPEIDVTRVSQNYTTSPVGTSAGGQFLNAAAELETSLSPHELLARLQSIETALGRIRELRWGPRTLDLDLLFYGDHAETVLETPTLTLPHPHLWYRRFVIDPLLEIAPDLTHPVMGRTIREFAQLLNQRPLICSLSGGDVALRTTLQKQAESAFPATAWESSRHLDAVLRFSLEPISSDATGLRCAASPNPVAPSGITGPRDSHSASNPGQINLLAFPTTPWETLCDVLTAALDTTRLVTGDTAPEPD